MVISSLLWVYKFVRFIILNLFSVGRIKRREWRKFLKTASLKRTAELLYTSIRVSNSEHRRGEGRGDPIKKGGGSS